MNAEQAEDVNFGLRLAKEVSRLEIGQSVVVKKELSSLSRHLEGTDGCLQRGGQLAGRDGKAVAVKVAGWP